MKRRVGKFVGLFVVTLFALAVMYVSGGRNDFGAQQKETDPTAVVETLAPVTVMPLNRQHIEILDSYAGTIQPLESFSLAFQLAGQVESLGTNQEGRPLDIGDRVNTGQILATLDTRILIARREEANANLENAQTEFQRLVSLRERSPGAVTQTAFQQATQVLAVAKAMKDIAEKNLENAQLVAPADGVISARMINPGETINTQQTVFELVQVDKVLLTVGVPESRIVAMQKQFNATRRAASANMQTGTPDPTSNFKVYVRRFDTSSNLEKDTVLEGTVYRIAETVNNRNGLFEVEVLLDNASRLLKPGIVAKADFVIREIDGFQVPVESVVFNDRVASLFFAQPATEHPTSTVDFVGMDVAEVPNFVAHRIEIPSYIEQGRNFILTDLPSKHDLLIVQGQHRLVEGRPLEIMSGTTSAGNSGVSPLSEIPPMAEVSRLGGQPGGK
ncbi:putative efflux pump membrane fusion protein [Bremerella volcania]|uniref:Putative efflux pump membrane fusion protein n=1 Tax=Bremerella volcania TaxID=2527984 RepID=A0A518CAF1_9BACT|nr:efflux RND transporter periplasmic adaptor subunit [Bremerella volcania]QDU76206.1 putative efflux pump membrane fusion protein [Bremerella volcania]